MMNLSYRSLSLFLWISLKQVLLFSSSSQISIHPQDTLFTRPSSWRDQGIKLWFNYESDLVTNPVGGKSQGAAYCDSYAAYFKYDFGKKLHWEGFSFTVSAAFRSGTNLSRKIDNQFNVNQVFGGETWHIADFHFLQWFADEKVALRGGRICPGDYFLTSPLYGRFVNNAFNGNPAAITYNFPMGTFPNAVWGLYLSIRPSHHWHFNGGVYTTNRETFANHHHGLDWTFRSPQGALLITEWIYLKTGSHPGNYKAGFVYVTGPTPRFGGGSVRGDYTGYLLLDQTVYPGITPFFAILLSPNDCNRFPLFMLGGIAYEGVFSFRPNDVVSLGVAYGQYSENLQRVQPQKSIVGGALRSHEEQTAETILELNYQVKVRNGCLITPSIQYVINPKGLGTIPNAVVFGLQTSLFF